MGGFVDPEAYDSFPDGFSENDIELLRRLRKPLAAELKSLAQQRLVTDILHAYLRDMVTVN